MEDWNDDIGAQLDALDELEEEQGEGEQQGTCEAFTPCARHTPISHALVALYHSGKH